MQLNLNLHCDMSQINANFPLFFSYLMHPFDIWTPGHKQNKAKWYGKHKNNHPRRHNRKWHVSFMIKSVSPADNKCTAAQRRATFFYPLWSLKGFTHLQRKTANMMPHRRNPIAVDSMDIKYFEMDSVKQHRCNFHWLLKLY